MQRYAVGISDIFSRDNKIKVVESCDEINTVFDTACTRRKEIVHIKEKLLDGYKTTEELKSYFIEYWGLVITSPYELGV